MSRRRDRSRGTIPAGKFKARCLELMNEVRERRTEYVITKRGKAVAKLVSCDEEPADAFGMLSGSVLGHDDIVAPDAESWGDDS